MRKIFLALLMVAMFAVPLSAWAADDEKKAADEAKNANIVIMNEAKLPWELNTWLVKTICVEGKVFLVSYVLGGGSGAAVASTQVMEERDGKVVPAKCDLDKYRKKD